MTQIDDAGRTAPAAHPPASGAETGANPAQSAAPLPACASSPRPPLIIQGGMGVGVSCWRLARAVSLTGQLGVVSGTALDALLARRLQAGDEGGHMRRALEHLPIPGAAKRILDRYFVPGGKPARAPFRAKPMPSHRPSRAAVELLIASNFVEVFLAREGHAAPVGINYLEKVQAPTLPSLFGALLAGVSCVLMGAGIPRAIPGILDRLARFEAVEMKLDVAGSADDSQRLARFDPADFLPPPSPPLAPPTLPALPSPPAGLIRPNFYAIVASATLAEMLTKKATGRVDGFIVEGPTAGGHNAPPRGPLRLTVHGEPVYGERDAVDPAAMRALGLPFWLAGSYGAPGRLAEALRLGAAGVQVGTAFAYSEESGIDPALKARVLALSRAGSARSFTDPLASPTGFPFKVVPVEGTISDPAIAAARERVCDLGYLRQAYTKPDGTIGWRCPAEPVADYIAKGGRAEETVGRVCVCNGLMATIGLGQVKPGGSGSGEAGSGRDEPALVTSGDDVATVARYLAPGASSYPAARVIESLLADLRAET